jgi:hypothetical protein
MACQFITYFEVIYWYHTVLRNFVIRVNSISLLNKNTLVVKIPAVAQNSSVFASEKKNIIANMQSWGMSKKTTKNPTVAKIGATKNLFKNCIWVPNTDTCTFLEILMQVFFCLTSYFIGFATDTFAIGEERLIKWPVLWNGIIFIQL